MFNLFRFWKENLKWLIASSGWLIGIKISIYEKNIPETGTKTFLNETIYSQNKKDVISHILWVIIFRMTEQASLNTYDELFCLNEGKRKFFG